MDNPFRSKLWQQTIRNENKLYPSEFCMSMTDPNGIFVRLSEINEKSNFGTIQNYGNGTAFNITLTWVPKIIWINDEKFIIDRTKMNYV